ncbi:MAG: sugar-transfer associated ATP-grasp domain-containing protein [Myxococcota bacterium]
MSRPETASAAPRGLLRRLFDVFRAPKDQVMGMNRRNLDMIYPRNPRLHFTLVNHKLKTKAILSAVGLPVAPTLATVDGFHQLAELEARLAGLEEFVIKPANGSGGKGIIVVAAKDGDSYVTAGGRRLGPAQVRKHVADIVFGVYTFDKADVAVVEPRLHPDPFFASLYPDGLSDIRVITVDGTPVLSMIRVPTKASDGRANLHQGAIGLGLDLATGRVVQARKKGVTVEVHPDTQAQLVGQQVPFWPDILDICRRGAKAIPLGYLGFDIVVDRTRGPTVLEVNARPGLEIQNVTGIPLRGLLRRLGLAETGA